MPSVGLFLGWRPHFPSPTLPADLSSAKRKFADSLNEFKFRCIGDAETDDEICIGEGGRRCVGILGPLQTPGPGSAGGGNTAGHTGSRDGSWDLPGAAGEGQPLPLWTCVSSRGWVMLHSLGWAEHGETSSPALRATPWLPRLRFPELIVREVCSQQGE